MKSQSQNPALGITLPYTKRSQRSKALSMTQKGLNQAHRNDSTEIWKLMSYCDDQTEADSCILHKSQDFVQENDQKSFRRSPKPEQVDQVKIYKQNLIKKQQSSKKSKRQNQNQKEKQSAEECPIKNQTKKKAEQNGKKQREKQEKSQIKKTNEEKVGQIKYVEKMNEEIQQYLCRQRCNSRSLSNSAFAKLYNRPCQQSYGYGNTVGIISNNLLKTHSIVPHTSQNYPQTYQSYKNALIYAKRTKINDEDRKQRIRRQFLKYFDDDVIEYAKNQIAQNKRKFKSEQKISRARQKSSQKNQEQENKSHKHKRKSLKEFLGSNEPEFVYRHKGENGEIKLSKDRHGLTCYVDSSFRSNEEALINFQKGLNPIFPEKVKSQDLNIDQVRRENYKKSIELSHPGHYMTPCVVTPYDKAKYSFRKKRGESVQN